MRRSADPGTARRLQTLDLNLLQVLNQLLIDRRVSLAAEHLDLSQPALSNALRRLRTALGDELFVRTAQGMTPTPYAEHLATPVAEALRILDEALAAHAPFDPASSMRRFTIAMTDIGEIYFVPRLMAALATRAPHCTLATVRGAATPLREGSVDLAVGLLPDLPGGHFQRRLFRHHYVCLCRRGHPVTRGAFTLARFLAQGHLRVVAADTNHGQVEGHLLGLGIRRDIRLEVPHFAALGHILQHSDLLALVPERLASSCEGPFKLVSLTPPMALPAFTIRQAWHARYQGDAGHRWLRELMVELFSDAGGSHRIERTERTRQG